MKKNYYLLLPALTTLLISQFAYADTKISLTDKICKGSDENACIISHYVQSNTINVQCILNSIEYQFSHIPCNDVSVSTIFIRCFSDDANMGIDYKYFNGPFTSDGTLIIRTKQNQTFALRCGPGALFEE